MIFELKGLCTLMNPCASRGSSFNDDF